MERMNDYEVLFPFRDGINCLMYDYGDWDKLQSLLQQIRSGAIPVDRIAWQGHRDYCQWIQRPNDMIEQGLLTPIRKIIKFRANG